MTVRIGINGFGRMGQLGLRAGWGGEAVLPEYSYHCLAQTMDFMVLDPNNDRGQQIDGVSEKGQEYQAVRIFGKDK